MYLFCLLILEYDVLFMMTSRICLSVEYNHEFLDITWPVGLLKNVSSVPFFSPSLSFYSIVMPPAQCLLLHFRTMSVSLSVFRSVWMKLASQEVSGGKNRRLRIVSGAWCCDEVFLRNAKLRSLNELTYQARKEFNLMQFLRALHIHRLHKQVIHIL